MFSVKRTPMKMKKKKKQNTKQRENMQKLTVNAAYHLLRTSNYQTCKKKKTIVCEQFNIKEKDQKYSESADLH